MSTQSQTVRGALSVMMLLGGFGLPLSASAQFAPSGGALLHGEQAAPPPPPVVATEPPADTTYRQRRVTRYVVFGTTGRGRLIPPHRLVRAQVSRNRPWEGGWGG
jgi:hypothetical protein